MSILCSNLNSKALFLLLNMDQLFASLNLSLDDYNNSQGGSYLSSINPSTGTVQAKIRGANKVNYDTIISEMQSAYNQWKHTPVPVRGEVLRQIGLALRNHKESLSVFISLEVGKTRSEALGEVQECIDIVDYAQGLSRQLGGRVVPSERVNHWLFERYLPLGLVGIITSFNFPHSIFMWNFALSLVCGNATLWKGASSTPLCTLVLATLIRRVLQKEGYSPALCSFILGPGSTAGKWMADDPVLSLISFTGSTATGQQIAETVAKRLGRSILELGGNNAIVVMPDANLDLALNSVFFGAIGTSGMRCTTTRRVIIHKDIYDTFIEKLLDKYRSIRIGSPLNWDLQPNDITMGPLHNAKLVEEYKMALKRIKDQGGVFLVEGIALPCTGFFVSPSIVEAKVDLPMLQEEVFAPILYVLKAENLDDAITINNSVSQGLSASLFTNSLPNIAKWMGPDGSDALMSHVNVSTSGNEIALPFGGHKNSGLGTESGGDSWKQYCRIMSTTINYSDQSILAQGVSI